MKIPKQLKIGGHLYKIRVADTWEGRADGSDGDDGYCFNTTNTLYIYSGLSKTAQEVTLIHEILHALNSTMNHEFLDSLSEQLYQVLNDNKLIKP